MSPASPRLGGTLRGALHVSIGVLLGLGLLRTWQEQGAMDDGHARAVLASLLAGGFVVVYAGGLVWERRGATRPGSLSGLLWVTLLVGVWLVGCMLTEGFLWVAFPLFFLVLFLIPGWWGIAAVGSMVGWSVLSAVVRAQLDPAGDPGAPPAIGAWLGPLLGALCAILAYAVFGQLRRDAERNRALVAELRSAQNELAATERTNGMLAERERLAREIHDTIAQGLGSIVLMARTARVDGTGERTLALIESTARENLGEARRFVRDLSGGGPPLEDSLRTLARDTEARATSSHRPLTVEVRVEGPSRTPPPAIVDALHRGAQASLANVVQHAGATRCVLTLTWWQDRVTVDIADDGAGFDPTRPTGGDSFGLAGLRARLAEVGGTVTIDSAPGEGTTVGLCVPSEEES